jgi:hypothetical protein
MVARAEGANDAVVLGQRKAFQASAKRILRLATELASLAQAIVILGEGDR